MAIRYYDLLGYAKARSVQFRIQLEYNTESPESLISDDLGLGTIKNAEILHDGSLIWSLGIRRNRVRSVSYQTRIRAESPEPLISGDLGIIANKSTETLHGGSVLGSLGLTKSWNRSVSYPTRIRSRIAGTTDKR